MKTGDKIASTLTANETTVTRPHRTFEEIINELKETMEERSWTVELSSCGAAHVVKNREVHCIIGCDGTLEIIPEEYSSFLEARDLDAIAAACTEIAANYQAEHGENKHE